MWLNELIPRMIRLQDNYNYYLFGLFLLDSSFCKHMEEQDLWNAIISQTVNQVE